MYSLYLLFFLLVNIDNKVGSIGFVSRIIPAVYPISIIRVDPETGDPLRNSKGLCIACKPGECNVKFSF
jgi:solute carrier family 27 fatty acid transporter 1/4